MQVVEGKHVAMQLSEARQRHTDTIVTVRRDILRDGLGDLWVVLVVQGADETVDGQTGLVRRDLGEDVCRHTAVEIRDTT